MVDMQPQKSKSIVPFTRAHERCTFVTSRPLNAENSVSGGDTSQWDIKRSLNPRTPSTVLVLVHISFLVEFARVVWVFKKRFTFKNNWNTELSTHLRNPWSWGYDRNTTGHNARVSLKKQLSRKAYRGSGSARPQRLWRMSKACR